MLVKDRMSSPVITLRPETPFQDALRLMHERRIRRIPIVDAGDRLVGIVAERDLLHASPPPATALSVWEMNYMLWKLQVSDIMTQRVLTVAPDTPIQEAATLMVDKKIGGLPVVDDDGHLVGVLTETDIFKVFVELLSTDQLLTA